MAKSATNFNNYKTVHFKTFLQTQIKLAPQNKTTQITSQQNYKFLVVLDHKVQPRKLQKCSQIE